MIPSSMRKNHKPFANRVPGRKNAINVHTMWGGRTDKHGTGENRRSGRGMKNGQKDKNRSVPRATTWPGTGKVGSKEDAERRGKTSKRGKEDHLKGAGTRRR